MSSEESFTEDQIRGIEMLFKQFDSDNSGKIDFVEFRMLCQKMGIEISDAKLKSSIAAIAGEGSEMELDFDQFVRWLQTTAAGSDPFSVLKAKIKSQGIRPLSTSQIQALQECFNTFDTDGSGSIDVHELGNVFSTFGHEYSHDEIKAMIDEVDADQSGEIEFEEFLLLMMSNFGQEDASGDEVQAQMRKYDTKQYAAAWLEESATPPPPPLTHLSPPHSTGCISRADFEQVMWDLCGDTLTEEDVKEIVCIFSSSSFSNQKKYVCIMYPYAQSALAADVASPNGRGKPTSDGLIEYMKWESLWEAVQDSALDL